MTETRRRDNIIPAWENKDKDIRAVELQFEGLSRALRWWKKIFIIEMDVMHGHLSGSESLWFTIGYSISKDEAVARAKEEDAKVSQMKDQMQQLAALLMAAGADSTDSTLH
jgi:hypothetical protein